MGPVTFPGGRVALQRHVLTFFQSILLTLVHTLAQPILLAAVQTVVQTVVPPTVSLTIVWPDSDYRRLRRWLCGQIQAAVALH